MVADWICNHILRDPFFQKTEKKINEKISKKLYKKQRQYTYKYM